MTAQYIVSCLILSHLQNYFFFLIKLYYLALPFQAFFKSNSTYIMVFLLLKRINTLYILILACIGPFLVIKKGKFMKILF